MRIIQAVVQLPASQRFEKRCVIFERASDGSPNCFCSRIILRQFRNENVIRVGDSAALVMDNVIFVADSCPNEAFAWKSWIGDGISPVPLLTGFCELAIPAAVTKPEYCGRQIAGRVYFVEARGI